MLAPIVLFVYNRPEHTRKTLESLKKNSLSEESELFVFADGPKESALREQLEKIDEARKVVRERNWCGKVNIVERKENMGLANSVISGVTEIINKFGKIIVLEDDLILSKNFLKYMNDALDRFENEEKVMQISGYMFPVEIKTKEDAFFLPFSTSWGWATWKRVWNKFDGSMKGLDALDKDTAMRRKFDLDGSYPYFKMLKAQKDKKIDSWAIRFYLCFFLNNGIALFPKKTLIMNMGFDGSGVHCKDGVYQGIPREDFEIKTYPSETAIVHENRNAVFKFLKSQSSFLKRAFGRIVSFFKKK